MASTVDGSGVVLLQTMVDHTPHAVGQARHAAQAALGDAPGLDMALLVISELVTNAVLHADGAHLLRVTRCDGHLLVEVEDETDGGMHPGPALSENYSEHGRGLQVVRELSQQCGVRNRVPNGKTVWAEIAW